MMHEEMQQLRQHERNSQDYEMNEEQLERGTTEDERHVNDSFLKEHKHDANERAEEDRKRSAEDADEARDTESQATRWSRTKRQSGKCRARNLREAAHVFEEQWSESVDNNLDTTPQKRLVWWRKKMADPSRGWPRSSHRKETSPSCPSSQDSSGRNSPQW